MTHAEKKEYLERYRSLDAELNKALLKQSRLLDVCCKCTAAISGMPRCASDKQSAYVALCDAGNRAGELWTELNGLWSDIYSAAKKLPDKIHGTVIVDRYIRGKSIAVIGDALGLSRYRAVKALTEAIEQIDFSRKK